MIALPPGLSRSTSPPKKPGQSLRSEERSLYSIQARARFLQWTALRDAAHLASVSTLQHSFPQDQLKRTTRDLSFLVKPGEIAPTEVNIPQPMEHLSIIDKSNPQFHMTLCTALPNALDRAIQMQRECRELVSKGCTLVIADTSGAIPAWLYLPSVPHEFPELTLETAHGTYLLVFADTVEAFLTHTPLRHGTLEGIKLSNMPEFAPCHKPKLSHLADLAKATADLTPRIKDQLLNNGIGPAYSDTIANWMKSFILHALATVSPPEADIKDQIDAIIEKLRDIVGPIRSLELSSFETPPSYAFEAMAEHWDHVVKLLEKSAFAAAPDCPRTEPDRGLLNLNCALSLAADRAGI